MIACAHAETKRFGKDRHGNQRTRCKLCGKTWTEKQAPDLLGALRIPVETAEQVLRMLVEGISIRSCARLTGVNRGTILNILGLVGERCQFYAHQRMRGLTVNDVEVDEVWGFVSCKEKTRLRLNKSDNYHGDAWTFTAIERTTKLLITWHVGKRSPVDAQWFMAKLAGAVTGKFQLTTDGFKGYIDAVLEAFGLRADFAQLIKIYGKPRTKEAKTSEARYSPGVISGAIKRPRMGNPDNDRISTSMVERQNLNLRMAVRRMTRLTNAFSKRWENHESAIALYFVWYNFGRPHITLKGRTPAMEAGLEDHRWTMRELLEKIAAA